VQGRNTQGVKIMNVGRRTGWSGGDTCEEEESGEEKAPVQVKLEEVSEEKKT